MYGSNGKKSGRDKRLAHNTDFFTDGLRIMPFLKNGGNAGLLKKE
jgi:hypothetical protein